MIHRRVAPVRPAGFTGVKMHGVGRRGREKSTIVKEKGFRVFLFPIDPSLLHTLPFQDLPLRATPRPNPLPTTAKWLCVLREHSPVLDAPDEDKST